MSLLKTVDPVVPISILISRLEKHRDYYLDLRASIPFWQRKRRLQYATIAATYDFEMKAALSLAATTQPIIGKSSSVDAWEEPRRPK